MLGGAGEMGSAAVADLVGRTGHEVTVGDVRPDAARALLERLGAPPRAVAVDVDDARSLARALDGAEVVLNATYMRHNVPVTDAAIAAGAHLVDLGSYWPETLAQLDRHEAAVAAGSRIVPGCGVAPGLTNVLARLGADQPRPRRRGPLLLVHHAPDVDVGGHRGDALRRQRRDLGRA